MSWKDIMDRAFEEKAEHQRKAKEGGEREKEEEERRNAESLRMALDFAPRIKPVFEEFARKMEWGEIEESPFGVGLRLVPASHTGVYLKIIPPNIDLMEIYYGTSSELRHQAEKSLIKMGIEEFTEDVFAEALVKKALPHLSF